MKKVPTFIYKPLFVYKSHPSKQDEKKTTTRAEGHQGRLKNENFGKFAPFTDSEKKLQGEIFYSCQSQGKDPEVLK